MPFPFKQISSRTKARSEAPHLVSRIASTTTLKPSVSGRAYPHVGYGKGEWIENYEGDMEWCPDTECDHSNTEQVEHYYGPEEHQYTTGWMCSDCGEHMEV